MTTALLRRTLGRRASTVGTVSTSVTIVALAHTSFLADAVVTAATWADRNAASITHPWASAAACSIAVHNFASAMATATVGAFAGTSSQRTVSTVKPSCTHALFGTIDSLASTLVGRCHAVIWAGCNGAVVANPALGAHADDVLGVASFDFALATSTATVFAARLITCNTTIARAANALASSEVTFAVACLLIAFGRAAGVILFATIVANVARRTNARAVGTFAVVAAVGRAGCCRAISTTKVGCTFARLLASSFISLASAMVAAATRATITTVRSPKVGVAQAGTVVALAITTAVIGAAL